MTVLLNRAHNDVERFGYIQPGTREALVAAGITSVQIEQYLELRSLKENVT